MLPRNERNERPNAYSLSVRVGAGAFVNSSSTSFEIRGMSAGSLARMVKVLDAVPQARPEVSLTVRVTGISPAVESV
jgi:hypothetical protein